MESSDSWITYSWIAIPIAALLYFGYLTLKRGASRPAQTALASVVFGVAGLFFSPLAPLAVYFARKASGASSQMDRGIVVMSRVGIVLGIIGSVILAGFILMAGIYFYAWLTNQYPFGPANP